MKIAAFDIGISSIGWCLCEQNDKEYKVIDCGVRIFTAAEHRKTGDSLAAPRREARLSRRRLYRRRTRLAELRNLLCTEFGLDKKIFEMQGANLPQIYKTSKEILSPWELRVKALDLKVDINELVRIILHIAKHRGYANLINNNEKDKGKVLSAIAQNQEDIKSYLSGAQMLVERYFNKEIKS